MGDPPGLQYASPLSQPTGMGALAPCMPAYEYATVAAPTRFWETCPQKAVAVEKPFMSGSEQGGGGQIEMS